MNWNIFDPARENGKNGTIDQDLKNKIQTIIQTILPNKEDINAGKEIYGCDTSWKISNSLDYEYFCNKNKDAINSIVNNYSKNEKEVVSALVEFLNNTQGEFESISKEKICYLLLKLADARNFKNIRSQELTEGLPLKLYAIKLLAENDKSPDCYSFELLINKLEEVRKEQGKKVFSDLAKVHDLVIEQFLKVNEPSERLYEALFNSLKRSVNNKDLEQKFIQKLAKYYGAEVDHNVSKDYAIKSLIQATIINDDSLNQNTTKYSDFLKVINEKHAFSSFLIKYNDKKSLYYAIDNLVANETQAIKALSYLKIYIAENDTHYQQYYLSNALKDLVKNHKVDDINSFNLIIEKAKKLSKNEVILNELIEKHLKESTPFSPEKINKIVDIIEKQSKKNKYNSTIKLIDYIQNQFEKDISLFFQPDINNIKNKIVNNIILQNDSRISKYITSKNKIKWGIITPSLLSNLCFKNYLSNEKLKEKVKTVKNEFFNNPTNKSFETTYLYFMDILDSDLGKFSFPSITKEWGKIKTELFTQEKFEEIYDAQNRIFKHCLKSDLIEQSTKKRMQTQILELQYLLINQYCDENNRNKKLEEIFLLASDYKMSFLPSDVLFKDINNFVNTYFDLINLNKDNDVNLLTFYRLNKLLPQDIQEKYFNKLENKFNSYNNSVFDYRKDFCDKLQKAGRNLQFDDFMTIYNNEFNLQPDRFVRIVLNYFNEKNQQIDQDFSKQLCNYIRTENKNFTENKFLYLKETLSKSKDNVDRLIDFTKNELNDKASEKTIDKLVENLINKESGELHPDILFHAIISLAKEGKTHLSTFSYKLASKILKNTDLTYNQKTNLKFFANQCLIDLIASKELSTKYDFLRNVILEKFGEDNVSTNLVLRWAVSVLEDTIEKPQNDQNFYKNFISFLVTYEVIHEKNIKNFVNELNKVKSSITGDDKDKFFEISNKVYEALAEITEKMKLNPQEREEIRKLILGISQN